MGQISRKVGFRPTKPGLQTLLVVLDCDNLPDVNTATARSQTSRLVLNEVKKISQWNVLSYH